MMGVSFFKQLISFILPISALLIVPYLIEPNLTTSTGLLVAVGIFFLSIGLVVLTLTISMFIRIGRGTLAPWSPTQELITTGVYGHVRNPMLSGVIITLLGESMMLSSFNILVWAIIFLVINSLYFKLSEEPGLQQRFGEEYREYRKNVPMWIPRLTRWAPASRQSGS